MYPPGVDQLIHMTKFLETVREMDPATPTHVALRADICRTRAIPVARRHRRRPGKCPVAQVGLCTSAETLWAGWCQGMAQLDPSLMAYMEPADREPWESSKPRRQNQPQTPRTSSKPPESTPPPPSPPTGDDDRGRGRGLILKAYADWWVKSCAASASLSAHYLQLRPSFKDRDWHLRIQPESHRRTYCRIRLGGIHLAEWHQRHEEVDLLCPECGVSLTIPHALTQCSLSRPYRLWLRARMERILVRDMATIDHPDIRSIIEGLLQRVRSGISIEGLIDPSHQKEWSIFLLGGPAGPPAPFPGGYFREDKELSTHGSTVCSKMLFALPVYVHRAIQVIEKALQEDVADCATPEDPVAPMVTGWGGVPVAASGVISDEAWNRARGTPAPATDRSAAPWFTRLSPPQAGPPLAMH